MKCFIKQMLCAVLFLTSQASGLDETLNRALLAFPYSEDDSIKEGKSGYIFDDEQHKLYISLIKSQGTVVDLELVATLNMFIEKDDKFYAWLQKHPDQRRILANALVNAALRHLENERQKGSKPYIDARAKIQKLMGKSAKPTNLNLEPENFKIVVDNLVESKSKIQTFKGVMDKIGLKYKLDTDGDAVIVFSYQDAKRTQRCWATSVLTNVGNYKVRKLFSYAYVGKEPVAQTVIRGALLLNQEMMTFKWSLAQSKTSGNYVLTLSAAIPESADAATTASILRDLGSKADAFEKENFGSDSN